MTRIFYLSLGIIFFTLRASEYAHSQIDMSETVKVSEITDKDDIKYIINDFQNNLNKVEKDAKIKKCELFTNYLEQGPGRDSSFGAICTVQNSGTEERLMMCNDYLVGKFHMTYPFISTTDAIGKFISINCPPGG